MQRGQHTAIPHPHPHAPPHPPRTIKFACWPPWLQVACVEARPPRVMAVPAAASANAAQKAHSMGRSGCLGLGAAASSP